MTSKKATSLASRLLGVLGGLFLLVSLAAPLAEAQVSERAAPVTGPGVTTIGNMATNARINVRSGPGVFFPAIGTLRYGTRVQKGICLGGGSARWCQIETMDGKISGYVSAGFLVEGASKPPEDGLTGGPDYWEVHRLGSNELLGVRLEPKSGSPALATLKNGEIILNLGCRMVGNTRWCRIRSITGIDVTGWVAGRYLRESRGPVEIQPPAGGGGGSGLYVVSGLASGDTLNVRTRPSTQGDVIAQLARGAKVQNLGCEQSGGARWCRIRTIGGVSVTGWVNGRYLQKG